ncbi:hypothetical protein FVEG_10754 [Fusarium verticillioides 7600]|uniref:Uncharacterized protein n=1 Tax=Gibberella moniliformis (strain M3125 / FGSC 7600) TaxID=334819 RepID=W7MLD9_GIBM7|nr:hypothetical protein FVEG_10754 [Fusarium verticillioides 7600]EWG51896.1 hypothetical protein FVEG_10754 [Fusarium verticillioides 7600]
MLPPPPPPPPSFRAPATDASSTPQAPVVPESGPARGLLLELIKHNGAPFNDHWAYFVRSSSSYSVGIVYEAVGDVRSGFQRQTRRNHDLTSDPPSTRIPLQWIDATFVNEELMLHDQGSMPMCIFEESLNKVKEPKKTLNDTRESPRRKELHKGTARHGSLSRRISWLQMAFSPRMLLPIFMPPSKSKQFPGATLE